MKLHNNQLNLIRHLIRFNILDYDSCLKMLDTENTGERTVLSYVFRPLTKNKYISKNKQGIVTVLRKGRELFPEEEPLISAGTSEKSRLRVLQVSKMAALMEENGVPSFGKLQDGRYTLGKWEEQNGFGRGFSIFAPFSIFASLGSHNGRTYFLQKRRCSLQ